MPASFCDIAKEHKSFGRFLAEWPSSDEIGLLESPRRNAADRLGGNTGQMLLEIPRLGRVRRSRRTWSPACATPGVDIAEEVKSKRDLISMQEQFNSWAKETDLPYVHLSRICAVVDRRELFSA